MTDDPGTATVVVMCPSCKEWGATADIPLASRIAERKEAADGKVKSFCGGCEAEFFVYHESV